MDKEIELQKALFALRQVINNKIDIENAFYCPLGPVKLVYGAPGNPKNGYKKGFGISHIIAKRDNEHEQDPKKYPETGIYIAEKLMSVLLYGEIYKTVPSKQCVHFRLERYEAVLSLNWKGESVNWLLTRWKVI